MKPEPLVPDSIFNPGLSTLLTTKPVTTCRHAENSDVLPDRSVAVAVMYRPTGALNAVVENDAFPDGSVVAVSYPRYCSPSPKPDGSHAVLLNRSTPKTAVDALFNVPAIVE